MALLPHLADGPGQDKFQDFYNKYDDSVDALNAITASNVVASKIITASWNADADDFVTIAHGLDYTKIVSFDGHVVASDGSRVPVGWVTNGIPNLVQVSFDAYNSTNIVVVRPSASILNTAAWNAATVEILIFYKK